MTEQEELIQDIRERLGEMPKGALPFDLLAFVTTIGQRYQRPRWADFFAILSHINYRDRAADARTHRGAAL